MNKNDFPAKGGREIKALVGHPLQGLVRPIMVFPNLNIAAFDAEGHQIAELQTSILSLLAEHMEKCGYDPEGCIIETRDGNWKMFRTEYGWNRKPHANAI